MATNTMTTTEAAVSAQSARDMIVVENLWKTYDMGSEQQVSALRGISLKIKANEYVAIMGPSGLRQIDLHELDRLPRFALQRQLLAQQPAGERPRRR